MKTIIANLNEDLLFEVSSKRLSKKQKVILNNEIQNCFDSTSSTIRIFFSGQKNGAYFFEYDEKGLERLTKRTSSVEYEKILSERNYKFSKNILIRKISRKVKLVEKEEEHITFLKNVDIDSLDLNFYFNLSL